MISNNSIIWQRDLLSSLPTWISTPSDLASSSTEDYVKASKPKLLVIYWPTACGKTALTIELAKKYNGEVINADSRQIYRGMNIGTGKVTAEEMQGIPHHLLDILDIHEMYGVGEFAPEARRIIADITARGKLPILSGGTGLFIDSVIGNFTIPEVPADWSYRDELEVFREKEGNEALWQKLHEVDPSYAAELDPRNYRYVMRGLEIWKSTGQSKKVLGQKTESPYDFLRITPYDGNREKLYERINQRVEKMFQDGLVEEVEAMLKKDEYGNGIPSSSGKMNPLRSRDEWDPGIQEKILREASNNIGKYSDLDSGSRLSLLTQWKDLSGMTGSLLKKYPGLNAIGYREILPYLEWTQSLEKTIELVQQNSRHYAKRQLTWFRRYNPEI
jgi:tRNA dimethylallyltransferase